MFRWGVARKPRVLFEGGIYHVTFRGNARADIFLCSADRERMRQRLQEALGDYEVDLLMYCLMRNHVHLLVMTPRGNLSAFMSSLLTGYTVYFNKRHDRVGHLMQGRYGAQVVEGNEYLLRLSRYIHLNPVFTEAWQKRSTRERIDALSAYRWSSYRGYAGRAAAEPWIRRSAILNLVEGRRGRAETRYRHYVESGLARTDTEFRELLSGSPMGIGSEPFLERLRSEYAGVVDGRVKAEDVALRRQARRCTVEAVERALEHEGLDQRILKQRRRENTVRALAAYLYVRRAGMTQREAAERLGLASGSTVSHQLRQLKRRLAQESDLRNRLERIENLTNRYFKG